MTNNVVPFPKEASTRSPQEDKLRKELEQKGTEVVLQHIEDSRRKGLERLETIIEDLENQEVCSDAQVESVRRTLMSTTRCLLTTIEALDNYSSLLAHDVSFLGAKQEKMGYDLFQTGAHVQAMMGALEEKGILTSDDIKKAWDKIVPEAVAEVRRAVTGEDDPA